MYHATIFSARFPTPNKQQNQPMRRDHTSIYVEQIRGQLADLSDQAITPQDQALGFNSV